jgi:hypothetical protein
MVRSLHVAKAIPCCYRVGLDVVRGKRLKNSSVPANGAMHLRKPQDRPSWTILANDRGFPCILSMNVVVDKLDRAHGQGGDLDAYMYPLVCLGCA